MAGLVPAIHALPSCTRQKGVDGRHKAGHDGWSGPGEAVKSQSFGGVV
jgi:hypothetical protein